MDNLIIKLQLCNSPFVNQKDAMNLPAAKLFNIPGAIHQFSRNNYQNFATTPTLPHSHQFVKNLHYFFLQQLFRRVCQIAPEQEPDDF